MKALLCIAIGFILGNFRGKAIIGKLFKNVKSANILPYGAAVIVFDMLKGIAASLICLSLIHGAGKNYMLSLCFLGTAMGHSFPFLLKFEVGNNIPVAAAFLLAVDFKLFLTVALTSAVFSLLTRSAAYGACTFALMMFVAAVDFGYENTVILSAVLQSAITAAISLAEIRPEKASV